MSTDRNTDSNVRNTRESEIFREPRGSGNCSSSIGAAQGIELFSGAGQVRRARPNKTIVESARQIPVFAETDVLVVGGGPAGTAAAIAAARLAPRCCWSSATIISAGSPPAVCLRIQTGERFHFGFDDGNGFFNPASRVFAALRLSAYSLPSIGATCGGSLSR